MRKKISKYDVGDCVAIDDAVRQTSTQGIVIKDVVGIILQKELMQMDKGTAEWLYLISYPGGIDDFWPYEIKPVNSLGKPYNNLYHKTKGKT